MDKLVTAGKVNIRELFKIAPYELLQGLKNNLSIVWEDGVITDMPAREIIVNRYALSILDIVPNISIVSKYRLSNYYNNGIYVSKTINKLYEAILEDVVNAMVKPTHDTSILPKLYKRMLEVVNQMYNELIYAIPEYVSSLNILDFTEVQLKEPLLKAIVNVKKNNTPEAIQEAYNVLDNLLTKDESLHNNKLSTGYISGTFNANQLKQILGPRGFGTEIDNQIFKVPIYSSFCLGLNDVYSMTVESRSAAKALFLSTDAIKKSEYFARELQLVTMRVEHLVEGDCGSKDYLDWYVKPGEDGHKADLPNLLGKYYLNEETGQEEEITMKHKHLEGKHIKLRSAMNCKLKDPRCVCSKCFGTLSYGLFNHTNLGHVSVTSATQKITQSILSTKHLIGSATTDGIYLDDIASQFFNVVGDNGYGFKKEVLKNKNYTLKLRCRQYEANGIKDLNTSIDISKLYPEKISWLKSIDIVKINDDGTTEVFPIQIAQGRTRGHFTHEFIGYILQTGYNLDVNDMYEIDLSKWNSEGPIIRVPQVEFSFTDLLTQLQNIFKSDGSKVKSKYKTTRNTKESFLQMVFEMVNKKLNVNIALLEVLIYAFTIVSKEKRDYRLGRGVEEPDVVKIKDIMPSNSLGGAYAWESVKRIMLSPTSFNGSNNIDHVMDIMVKPQEVLKDYGIPVSYKDRDKAAAKNL